MPSSHNPVVVITYDATDRAFLANPDPVDVAYGSHKLYFALQTVLGDDGVEARFESIQSSDGSVTARTLDDSPQLSVVDIKNDNSGPDDQPEDYLVRIHYQGEIHPHDPTVILKPPPPGTLVNEVATGAEPAPSE